MKAKGRGSPRNHLAYKEYGLPYKWIITTKYKQNYTRKNQWQSNSNEYYNVLDNCNNNKYAKKEKGNKTVKELYM